MEKETERITKSLAIVERQINELKDSGNKTALDILRKKEARLKEELKGTQMTTNALAKNLLSQRKNIKGLSKIEFNDLIRRLSKRPEYAFLKTMPKDTIKTDLQRTAKPVGWRFKGRGNYDKPTAKQIVAGKKSGRVYNERRPLRSDVSQVVKLKQGGNISGKWIVWDDFNKKIVGTYSTEAEAKKGINFSDEDNTLSVFSKEQFDKDTHRNKKIEFLSNGEIKHTNIAQSSNSESGTFEFHKVEKSKIGEISYEYDLDGVISESLDSDEFDSELYITNIQVNKDYRNLGVAKKLLAKIISFAKEKGIDVITLRRDDGVGSNKGSDYDNYLKSIYEKMGFVDNDENTGMYLPLNKTKMKKGGSISDKSNNGGETPKISIEFLNKEKGFKKDVKYFNSYNEAVKWGNENLEKFNPDMIKIKFSNGGNLEESSVNKLINDQITYIISLNTVKEKKSAINVLINNLDDWSSSMTKTITLDNLKYALKQTTVSKVNEVLKTSLNAIMMEEGGNVDLFQDYNNIPKNVTLILEKYTAEFGDDFGAMDFADIEKMQKEVEAKGYTFDYDMDGSIYGLRPINVPLNHLEGYEDEYKDGGNVDSDEILKTAKFNVSRIKEGKTSATKFTYYERLDEVNKLIDSLEKGTIKPARIIGTGYRGNTKKIANNWLIKEKAIAEKTIELLEEPTANKKTISLYSQIKRSEKIAKELFEEDGILVKYVKNNKFDSDLFEKYLQDKFNSKLNGENILNYWSKQLDMIPSDYYNGDEEYGYILENVEFEQDAKKRASQLFDIYKSLPTTTKTKTSSLAFNIKKHSKEIIDLMIEEITRLTNTRPLAVKKFFEQHNLTEKEISNISLGLGMGKIKPSDFSGAIVGDKVSEKAIIKFAKSNQAYKVEPMSKEDALNRDIKLYLELNIKKEGYNSINVRMAQLVIDSLGDANYHEEAYQFAKLIDPKLTTKEKYYKSELMNPTPSDREVARKVSEMAKYDGHAISEAYEYFLKSKDFIKEAIYLNQVFNPKSSKKAPSNKVNSIKDASYISNRDIISLTIKRGSDTITINGDDIFDGIYLKNSTKMEQGGNIGRTISFMDWRGDVRTGVITERLKRGYEVMTSDGVALVEDSEIIE
jgi:ribosomal protein S18 acetylase RimI-like enzyme